MVKDGIPDFRVRPPGHGGHPLQACPVPGPPGVGGYIDNIVIIILYNVLNVPLDELARHVSSHEEVSGSIPGLDKFEMRIFCRSKMHALCPSHRQTGDSRGDSRLSMSVTLTSDHSKIFFAAVTAAFAAPPPGRTATAAAAALRPLPPAARRCVPLHCRTQPPHCHSRTASLSSATRRRLAVTCQRVARRVPPRQHCRCTQAATACQCR